MNILYICADRGIPIRGHKGAAVHVRSMAAAFTRAGSQVTIVTPRPGPEDGSPPEGRLIHVPLPAPPTGDLDKGAARDRQAHAYNGVLLPALRSLTEQRRFDLIYERLSLWSDVGARLARLTGIPLVVEVNAPLRQEAARYRHLSEPSLAARIEESQLSAARAIVAVSRPVRGYLTELGVPPDKVRVLPNGVDPRQFHPAVRGGSVHDRHGLKDRIIVGFVGRARPWHDLNTLLRAVALLRARDHRFHLLLVGQMPDDLAAKLESYGLQEAATITGPVPHERVPLYMAAMDVAVSPSLPLPDAYFSPLKLFEYLACGAPTVAADVGQPSSMLRDQRYGLLYRPGDAASLAEQVLKLIDNPAAARRIAWQGAAWVLSHHTWDGNARAVLNWFRPPEKEAGSPSPATTLPILDHKLRQRLYRATRKDLAGSFLVKRLKAAGMQGSGRPRKVIDIEVLKYKPGRRCVLAYTLLGKSKKSGRAAVHKVIGKVFRDERGRRLHQLQDSLWRHGFGPAAADKIHVPQSMGYEPKMRMHLQEMAAGRTINELARLRNIEPLMPLAARAITKLHNWSAPPSANGNGAHPMRTYALEEELENLARFKANLATSRPSSTGRVATLHAALVDWAGRLPAKRGLEPIHRDYYYSQLLFDGDRVTLIDFDLFALGDPAIDVANFAAHLHFLGLDLVSDRHAYSGAADLFLDEYARVRPVGDDFWQRFAFYRAATFFRLLNVVAPRPGLAHLFEDIVELVVASMDGGRTVCLEDYEAETSI